MRKGELVFRIETRPPVPGDPIASYPWRFLLNGVEFYTRGGLVVRRHPQDILSITGTIQVDRIEFDEQPKQQFGDAVAIDIGATGRVIIEDAV